MTQHRDQTGNDPLLEAGLERAFSHDTLPVVPRVTESEPVHIEQKQERDNPAPNPGRFQILGEVARGGMGTVLEVFDRDLGRTVAVKVLHQRLRHDENARRRFLTEAQITGQLHHPGIPPIHDLGRGPDGTPSIVMELIRGRTLADILKERSSPAQDQPRLLRLFSDLCRIVAYAHGSGVVHRDIKPLNVKVGPYGEVFLLDWGVARILRNGEAEASTDNTPTPAQATRAGTVVGTPGYMAPEQARGEVSRITPATDVFALGCMLCEILTGQPPVTGTTEEVRHRLAAGDLDEGLTRLRASDVDAELLGITQRALAPSSEDRFPDARALRDALLSREEQLTEKARSSERARIAAESRANAERRLRRFTIIGSVALVVVAGTAFGIWDHFENKEHQQVEDALREAQSLVATAEASDSDLTAWELAETGVSDAASTYQRGTSFADLEARVSSLQARVDAGRDQAIRETQRKEDNQRLRQVFEDVMYGLVEPQNAAQEMFLDTVGDPWGESASTLAARIRARGLDDFAPFLEAWAMSDHDHSEPLLELASLLDPDETRQRIRDAWLDNDDLSLVPTIARQIDPADTDAHTIRLITLDLLYRQPRVRVWMAGTSGVLADRDNASLARHLLQESLLNHPDDVPLHMLLARYWTDDADPAEAAQALTEATTANALRPDLVAAWDRVARTLQVLERIPEAISWRRRILEARPDHYRAYVDLAALLTLSPPNPESRDEAEQLLTQAIAINEDDSRAWFLMAQARQDEDRAGMLEALRLAAENAEEPVWFLPYGQELRKRNELGAAIEHFTEAVARWPADLASQYLLGTTLKEADRPQDALEPANALAGLGDHLRQEHGFLDQAAEAYRMAYELHPDPEMNRVSQDRRIVMIALGRHDDLLEQEFLNASRSNAPDAWFQLGFDLDIVGEKHEALIAYQKAWDRGPSRFRFQYGYFLAGTLGELNLLEEALPALDRAVAEQDDPTFGTGLRDLYQRQLKLRNGGQHDGSINDDIARAEGALIDGQPEIAVGIYRRLFAEALEQGHRPRSSHTMKAAGAAVAAAQATDEDRDPLLREALDWSRLALDYIRTSLKDTPFSAKGILAQFVLFPNLAPVRNRPRTLGMSDDLVQEWERFWEEVDALVQETARK